MVCTPAVRVDVLNEAPVPIWPMGAQFKYYEKDPIKHNGILNLGYDEAKIARMMAASQ